MQGQQGQQNLQGQTLHGQSQSKMQGQQQQQGQSNVTQNSK